MQTAHGLPKNFKDTPKSLHSTIFTYLTNQLLTLPQRAYSTIRKCAELRNRFYLQT